MSFIFAYAASQSPHCCSGQKEVLVGVEAGKRGFVFVPSFQFIIILDASPTPRDVILY